MIRISFPIPKLKLFMYLNGFKYRADTLMSKGLISEIPKIIAVDAKGPYSDGFSVAEIHCKKCDQDIWFAFFMGIDYCRNNIEVFNVEGNKK